MSTRDDSRLSIYTLNSDALGRDAGGGEEEEEEEEEETEEEEEAAALKKVFNLSRRIFTSGNPEEDAQWPSCNYSVWQSNVRLPGSCILYATHHHSSDPLGFLFILSKAQPEIGRAMPHIWLAGVDPFSRGLGVFALLVEEAKKMTRQRGEEGMTVCTYPKKFANMYRILTLNGWEEAAWRENHAKVLMKLAV